MSDLSEDVPLIAPKPSDAAKPTSSLLPAIVGSALLMQTLDTTIIANALPAMSQALHTAPLTLNLAITSYMLASAAFLPVSAWVADRFGARTVFAAAMLAFAVTSALCGFAQTLPQLVLARLAQGAAGAMMVPVGRLLLLRSVPKAELVAAMAIYTMPAVFGPVVGPPLGGFIVTFASWRWIFFLNAPIALIGAVLVLRYVPNIAEAARTRLDWVGFLLTGFGSAGLLFGFSNLGRGLLAWPVTLALIVSGAGLIAAFVWHARRVAHPILDPSLFRRAAFTASVVGGAFLRFPIGASPFLLALVLQYGMGMSALAAGMTTLFSAIGALVMKSAAPPLLRRFGFRPLLIVNGLICAGSFMLYGLFSPTLPHWILLAILLVGGFVRSLQFTGLNALAYADLRMDEMSGASTLSSVGQQLSQAIGVGLAVVLLDVSLKMNGAETLNAAAIGPVFVAMGAISLIGLLFLFPLARDAGAEVSGRVRGA